jgi:hypothetical protein
MHHLSPLRHANLGKRFPVLCPHPTGGAAQHSKNMIGYYMSNLYTDTRRQCKGGKARCTWASLATIPKPVQKPHPPILFGGATSQWRQRVVTYCDGWIPIDVLIDDLPAALADLRRHAETAGGDPATLSVCVLAFTAPSTDHLKRYQDMGVERVVLVSPRRLATLMPTIR